MAIYPDYSTAYNATAMPLHSARLLLVLVEPGPWGIATADAAAAAELWEVHDSVVLALVALHDVGGLD